MSKKWGAAAAAVAGEISLKSRTPSTHLKTKMMIIKAHKANEIAGEGDLDSEIIIINKRSPAIKTVKNTTREKSRMVSNTHR